MAATDSGGETGYESNDSNVTFESSKSADGDSMNDQRVSPDSLPLVEANNANLEEMQELDEGQPPYLVEPGPAAFNNPEQPTWNIANWPIEECGNHVVCAPFLCGGGSSGAPSTTATHGNHRPANSHKMRAHMFYRKHAVRWKQISPLIPHIKDMLGERKLRLAANLNNVEGVQELLEMGVDPCSADERKRTALHFAACKGYSDVVHVLLRNGADPNQKDVIGNTALHLAVCTNHINVVTLLLKAGADVKSTDFSGRTPLQLAQSKLKLIQMDTSYTSHQLKMEVHQVIEMLQTYLQRTGLDAEAELLSAFSRKLDLTHSKEEVDDNVRDLLFKLSDLNLHHS